MLEWTSVSNAYLCKKMQEYIYAVNHETKQDLELASLALALLAPSNVAASAEADPAATSDTVGVATS